jgi:hypothetical protein
VVHSKVARVSSPSPFAIAKVYHSTNPWTSAGFGARTCPIDAGEAGQGLRGEGGGKDGDRERAPAAAVAGAGAARGCRGRGMRPHGRRGHLQVPEGGLAPQPYRPCLLPPQTHLRRHRLKLRRRLPRKQQLRFDLRECRNPRSFDLLSKEVGEISISQRLCTAANKTKLSYHHLHSGEVRHRHRRHVGTYTKLSLAPFKSEATPLLSPLSRDM